MINKKKYYYLYGGYLLPLKVFLTGHQEKDIDFLFGVLLFFQTH